MCFLFIKIVYKYFFMEQNYIIVIALIIKETFSVIFCYIVTILWVHAIVIPYSL